MINASNCHHCSNIKSKKEEFVEFFKSNEGSRYYNLIEYETSSMIVNIDFLPPVLGKIIWFPFIFKVSKEVWVDLQNGVDRREDMKILNGEFDKETNSYKHTYQLVSSNDNNGSATVNPSNPYQLVDWILNY